MSEELESAKKIPYDAAEPVAAEPVVLEASATLAPADGLDAAMPDEPTPIPDHLHPGLAFRFVAEVERLGKKFWAFVSNHPGVLSVAGTEGVKAVGQNDFLLVNQTNGDHVGLTEDEARDQHGL